MKELSAKVVRARTYRYDETRDCYCCTECDYTNWDAGAVKLHAAQAHGGGARRGAAERTKRRRAEANECQHEWRLLRRDLAGEAAAMQDGWISLCKLCGDLAR